MFIRDLTDGYCISHLNLTTVLWDRYYHPSIGKNANPVLTMMWEEGFCIHHWGLRIAVSAREQNQQWQLKFKVRIPLIHKSLFGESNLWE